MGEGCDLFDSNSICFTSVLADHVAIVCNTGMYPKTDTAAAVKASCACSVQT